MHKIGIITVYDSLNYGSKLQAYALMSILTGHNCEAYFVKWNKYNFLYNEVVRNSIIT